MNKWLTCCYYSCMKAGKCQGHYVTWPKQPRWTTLCSNLVAGSASQGQDYVPLSRVTGGGWWE